MIAVHETATALVRVVVVQAVLVVQPLLAVREVLAYKQVFLELPRIMQVVVEAAVGRVVQVVPVVVVMQIVPEL